MMKPISMLCLALLATAMTVPAPVRAECEPERTVALAVDVTPDSPMYEPVFAFYDTIFSRIGRCVRFKPASLARSLDASTSGLLDGDYFRIARYGERAPEAVRVDEPVARLEFAVYARDERFRNAATPDDLLYWSGEALTIGYTKGVLCGEPVVRMLREHSVHTLVNIPEQVRGIRMLAQGRLDLFLGTNQMLDALLQTDRMKDSRVFKAAVGSRDLAYVFLHRRLDHLVPDLERAIREVKEDGTYERLFGFAPPRRPAGE